MPSTVVGVHQELMNPPGDAEHGVGWGSRDEGAHGPGACSLGRSVCVLPINPQHLISRSSLWRQITR